MASDLDTSGREADSELQETNDAEDKLYPKSVNTNLFSGEQNLIDLNTPNTPLKGSADCSTIAEKTSSDGADLLSGEPCPGGDSISPGDQTMFHKSSSSYSNSTSSNSAGGGLEQNSLYVSHTESGYLTDSVTSHISHERHPSMSESETDKTPSQETRLSSSSENDITPCTEKLFALSDSLARLSTTSNGTAKHMEHGRIGKCEKLIEFDNGIPKYRLDSLTQIDSNCDRNGGDADGNAKRYSTGSRPESLLLLNAVQDQNHDGNHRYEAEGSAGKMHGQQSSNTEKCENRRRSKSSGFPIPRLKEGADIGDEGLSKSLPHGQVMKLNSGMIEFVADDLMEKIRRSSPMSKTASSDVSSRRSSQLSLTTSIDSFNSSTMATSMTSGMSQSYPQSPDCIPPIDPMAVHEIEIQARSVADGLDLMMGNLRNNLHKMSAITVGCEEAYRTSVAVTCDSVDSSIKSMYALMAKCEELSQTMQPIYKLADQIKEIKRLLDRFEHQLADKP